MHILATGFEPFGADGFNASQAAVGRLPSELAEHRVTTAILPVSFQRSGPALLSLLEKHQPDILFCIGEAGGRNQITPEQWAANEDDARIADNDGAQPRSTAIDPGGAGRIASRLDPEAAVRSLRRAGYPARLSEDAGRFVCNHVAYLAYSQPVPALFIHVPALRPAGIRASVGAETDTGPLQGDSKDPSELGDAVAVAILSALG